MNTLAPNLFKLIKVLVIGIFLFQLNPAFTQSSAVDEYIESFMETNHIPGCAAILVKQGRVVYENYFGYANLETGQPVDHNTIFMLASTSKAITATAIMNECENGMFEISDSIDTHLPFDVRNPNHPDVPITFQQLLTHTSSIKDNWDFMPFYKGDSPIELYTYLSGYLVPGGDYYANSNYNHFMPGVSWDYSNIAIALCGYITEYQSGIPFDEYCNDSIFNPLCMNNTAWFLSGLDTSLIARPYSYIEDEYRDNDLYGYSDYPSGQLRTTVVSLAKFMQMYINYGTFNNYRVLDAATIETMNSVQFPGIRSNQGLVFYSFSREEDTFWGHAGGDPGVATRMCFDMVNKTGAAVLMNGGDDATAIMSRLLNYAAEVSPGTGQLLDCDYVTSAQSSQLRKPSILIFPNPGTGIFNLVISNAGGDTYIEIFNNLGSLVISKPLSKDVNSFDITDHPAGIYYIRVIQDENNIDTKIIIKN